MGKKLNLKAKNWPIFKKKKQKKRDISGQNKQAGAEFKKKNKDFLGKICEKNWVLRPQINQFSKKKGQAGAELKKKNKVFFGQEIEF